VIYCYGEYQSGFAKYPWVEFHEGSAKVGNVRRHTDNVVIDDLMNETNDVVANLFTKISHHRSVSVIHITQTCFTKTNRVATISLNTPLIGAIQSRETAGQIPFFGEHCIAEHNKFLVEAFKDATAEPHSYLLLDLRPETEERYRVRANIFQGEQQIVYQPK